MSTYDNDMISRYVDGEMTIEEKQAFEQMLLRDAGLKKEVDLYKEVNDTLKTRLHPDEGEKDLRYTLEKLRGEYFSKSMRPEKPSAKVVQFNRKRWLAVAAAAAAVVIVMIWSPWSQPDLYRQYASLEMTSFAERGTSADSLAKEVTEKFNDKKFEETIPLFETLLVTDTANSYLRFHYAAALLETRETEKARAELTQLYNGASVFRYNAVFFMALSYLKEKDEATAIEWLNRIPEDAEMYSKSRELLKKL